MITVKFPLSYLDLTAEHESCVEIQVSWNWLLAFQVTRSIVSPLSSWVTVQFNKRGRKFHFRPCQVGRVVRLAKPYTSANLKWFFQELGYIIPIISSRYCIQDIFKISLSCPIPMADFGALQAASFWLQWDDVPALESTNVAVKVKAPPPLGFPSLFTLATRSLSIPKRPDKITAEVSRSNNTQRHSSVVLSGFEELDPDSPSWTPNENAVEQHRRDVA